MRKLIIATWGNFYSWSVQNYYFEGIKTEGRTSLSALVKKYPDAHVLIFVPDTVYAGGVGRNGCFPSDRISSLPSSYAELVESVKSNTESWILKCSSSSELVKALEEEKRIDIEVVPSIGAYKYDEVNYDFKLKGTSPAFFYSSWLSGILLEKLIKGGFEEIVVDLTHGVNYIPLSTVSTLEAVLSSICVALNKKKRLKIVESEPVSGKEQLEIFVVREKDYEPETERDLIVMAFKKELSDALNRAHYELLSKSSVYYREIASHPFHRKLASNKLLPYSIAAANIVFYSTPLAAVYLASELSGDFLKEASEFLAFLRAKSINLWHLERKDKTLEIYPELLLMWKPILTLLYSSAILSIISRVKLEDFNYETGVSLSKLKDVLKYLGSMYRVISEKELSSLKEKCLKKEEDNRLKEFFKHLKDACKDIPDKEITALEKNCIKRKTSCFISVSFGVWPNEKCSGSFELRNFKAHAGLESNVVEGMVEGEELFLRYRNKTKDCWRDVVRKNLNKPDF